MYCVDYNIKYDYYSSIPIEMNIDTIYNWLYDGYYHTVWSLESDIILIKINCNFFNDPNSPLQKDVEKVVDGLF